jgi:GH25 family lysozyme M1 (1,4-beta-N-acetylmuramidase)
MRNGIDISYHNGSVDLLAAKNSGIEFAIIRMGFGDDVKSQDDKQFLNNVSNAAAAGMPFGLYLYSYANNMDHVESEVQHTVRLLKHCGRPDVGVWWDSEDASTSAFNLVSAFSYYKNRVEELAGVPVGLYTYKAFYSKHYGNTVTEREYPLWYARYNSSLPADYYKDFCDIWQYASDHRITGIGGNVDVNRMHRRAITAVQQVWKGLYGNADERQRLLERAGYNYAEVQKLVNEYGKAADEVIENKYGIGADRVQRLKAAGYVPYIVQQIVNMKVM